MANVMFRRLESFLDPSRELEKVPLKKLARQVKPVSGTSGIELNLS